MVREQREVWGDLPTTAFIGRSVLFKTLDDDSREDLLRLATVQDFTTGDVVLVPEAEDDLFLVRDGVAALTARVEDEYYCLATLEPGAYFDATLLRNEAADLSFVLARTELVVVRFPAAMIAALGERFPRLSSLLEALRAARRRGGELQEIA